MKQIWILTISLILIWGVSSCGLNDYDQEYEDYLKEMEEYQKKAQAQYKTDSTLIVTYLEENDSIALHDSLYGIFYHIINPGEEEHPDRYAFIEVAYKGQLLDGTVFDQTEADTTQQFLLTDLISGWQIGVPKIGAGGKIILYLPSYYGYGENEVGDVPANSVLIFDIDLVDFY